MTPPSGEGSFGNPPCAASHREGAFTRYGKGELRTFREPALRVYISRRRREGQGWSGNPCRAPFAAGKACHSGHCAIGKTALLAGTAIKKPLPLWPSLPPGGGPIEENFTHRNLRIRASTPQSGGKLETSRGWDGSS